MFNPAHELDPTALRPDRPRRKPREPKADADAPRTPEWDTDTFVKMCVGKEGRVKDVLVDAAVRHGLSKAHAKQLLRLAEDEGRVHRWVAGANKPVRFATIPQPLIETERTGA